jgi:hypothetical protein
LGTLSPYAKKDDPQTPVFKILKIPRILYGNLGKPTISSQQPVVSSQLLWKCVNRKKRWIKKPRVCMD